MEREGVPCILKKKKGVLVLEIENYGVVNIADEKYLKGIYETKHKKKSRKNKRKQKKVSSSSSSEEEEHEIQKIEKVKEEPKIEEVKEEIIKQEPKEIIKEEIKENKQEEIVEEENEKIEEEILKEEEIPKIVETKEEKEEEEENVEKVKRKPQGKPMKKQPYQPNQPHNQHKKPKKTNPKPNVKESTVTMTEEEENEQVNYVASSGMLTNGTNDVEIDKDIARGYLLVNTGQLAEAIKHFDGLIKKHPNIVAAYMGRGSSYAMVGQLQQSLKDFNMAVKKAPTYYDAYKRRGQVKFALGMIKDAFADYSKSIELDPEIAETYRQRGSAYHQVGNFELAVKDFKKSLELEPGDPSIVLELAMCYNGMGLVDEAIANYTKAMNTKEDFNEAYIHFGQLYRDMGCYVKGKQLLEKSIKIEPNHYQSYYVLANIMASAGRHREALNYIEKSSQNCPPERGTEVYRLYSTICLALGMNSECLKVAKKGTDLKDPSCWYFGELAKYQASMLEKPFLEFNFEYFPPLWKVNFAKRLSSAAAKKYPPGLQPKPITAKDIQANENFKKELIQTLLKPAIEIGEKMQYEEIGFGRNGRQYMACGLSCIYVAQLLKEKQMYWRDIAEIFVKFRQVAEPADGALWIDKLPRQEFEQGYGSNTTLKTAQTRVARYWPMFERTFTLFKELYKLESGATKEKIDMVMNAKTVEEVQQIIKRDNFFMTTICRNEEGMRLIGTWLLIEKVDMGSMFSIKTPCTPKRYKIFDEELKKALSKYYDVQNSGDEEKVLDATLRFCYLWFNFMPLTRGTAACGMYWLFTLLLAAGYKQVGVIPKSFQCDWEALLTDNQNEYIEKMKGWIKLEKCDVNSYPKVLEELPTLKNVLVALNLTPLLVPLK